MLVCHRPSCTCVVDLAIIIPLQICETEPSEILCLLAWFGFRCSELEEKLTKQERESQKLTEWLMTLIRQKYRLQKEIQAWEVRQSEFLLNQKAC